MARRSLHVPVGDVLGAAVDAFLRASGLASPPTEEQWRRARAVIGQFRSGLHDVARNHDRYLQEAFDT